MTDELHRTLGLTDQEFEKIIQILDREPNHLELAMYSVSYVLRDDVNVGPC